MAQKQMQFLCPRSQSQIISWDIVILLESSYDSGENELLFMKTGAKVQDLWLDMFSGCKWPNVISRCQTLKSRTYLRYHNFVGLILWFWREWGPVCENWSRILDLWLDRSSFFSKPLFAQKEKFNLKTCNSTLLDT